MKTTRLDQLDMKAGSAESRGRGRGRGRGKGEGRGGRGRGRGNTSNDASAKEEDKKRKTSEKALATEGKGAKKEKAKDEKDWEADWQEHWNEEWGDDWNHETWASEEKQWDEAVWWEGYHSLAELDSYKAATPEASAGSTKPSKAPRVKKDAKEKNEAETEVKNRSRPSGRSDSSKATTSMKDNDEKESATKKKREASETKAKAKAKAASNKQVSEFSPFPTHRTERIQEIVKFGKKFFGREHDDEKDVKAAIRAKLKEPKEVCRLNLYWTRSAGGVHVKPLKRDCGCFGLGDSTSAKLQPPVLWAVVGKVAEMWVSCLCGMLFFL